MTTMCVCVLYGKNIRISIQYILECFKIKLNSVVLILCPLFSIWCSTSTASMALSSLVSNQACHSFIFSSPSCLRRGSANVIHKLMLNYLYENASKSCKLTKHQRVLKFVGKWNHFIRKALPLRIVGKHFFHPLEIWQTFLPVLVSLKFVTISITHLSSPAT